MDRKSRPDLMVGVRLECRDKIVAAKTSILQMIEALKTTGLYDPYTHRRLHVLASTFQGADEIGQKERVVIQQLFARHIDETTKTGKIRYRSLLVDDKSQPRVYRVRDPKRDRAADPNDIMCQVQKFLGFGNMGPVYAVTVDGKPCAIKIYSAREIKDVVRIHGKFGLGGILDDLDERDQSDRISSLGQTVLDRKETKGVYGRSRRIVKVHDVGIHGDYLYLRMDLLDVEPINKVDPTSFGGDLMDLVSWAVDCTVGLCHLHVEERRLHLNIRPEAFIKQTVKDGKRLPKYTFFFYPKTFARTPNGPSHKTEFIMVDHFDNSVDVADKEPKGLATVGSWLFLPPEQILQLLRVLKEDYATYVENGMPVDEQRSIKLKRTQMDDVWALGLTLYQFLSGGKSPFGEPGNLAHMVNSILLTKFDFDPIEPRFKDLLASMLDKDPKKRFMRLMEGCPAKLVERKVLAEAVLYKLEQIAVQA